MTESAMPPSDFDDGFPPRDDRVPLQRKISLKFKEFRGFVTEFSDNLSLGGMFIRTTTPAPIGTVFDFEFALEEGEALIHGIGQVIWVRDRDEGFDHPAGIGVRFLFVDPEGRQLVERMVADRLSGGAPITELELGPAPVQSRPLVTAPLAFEAAPPRLGALDHGPTPRDDSPWSLDSPPLEPANGLIGPIAPLLAGPRSVLGRGAIVRPRRSARRGWKLAAVILGLLVLAALGWYGATLLGLVGSTEPEKVPLKVSPIPGPVPERLATLPPAEPAAVVPMPALEPSPGVEPSPSSAHIEPVEPAAEPVADESAETVDEATAAVEAVRSSGRRGQRHFRTIEAITWEQRPDGIDVVVTADGKVEEWDYTLLHLTNPPRELIKIENVERGFTATTLEVGSPDLPRIRIGFHTTPGGNELHIVLDLATPSVRVEHTDARDREIRLKIVGPR